MTARLACLVLVLGAARGSAADWERDPIRYSTAPADNAMNRLAPKLADGTVKLDHQRDSGHLRSLLTALHVPESSQVLVFSKTSLQRRPDRARAPRGRCTSTTTCTSASASAATCWRCPPPTRSSGPCSTRSTRSRRASRRFTRQTDNCLTLPRRRRATGACRGTVVRSVFPDRDGQPILSGRARSGSTTPARSSERWGGWYVTGTHGKPDAHGQPVVAGRRATGRGAGERRGQNVTDLHGRFTAGLPDAAQRHRRPDGAGAPDRRCTTGWPGLDRSEGRIALHARGRRDRTKVTSASLGDELVEVLLFRDEAKLTAGSRARVRSGRSSTKRGPFDKKGRSLRQFDLKTRLFKYPCSYLVYADAFQKLPAEIKEYALRRLYAVLTGADGGQGVRPPVGRRPRGDPGDSGRHPAGPAGLVEVTRPGPAARRGPFFVPEAIMHAITVDSAAAATLAAAATDVEVWDGDGRLLGLFVPEARDSATGGWDAGPPPGRLRLRGVAAEKLRAAEAEAKVRDRAGWLIGHFLPCPTAGRSVRVWKPTGGNADPASVRTLD